MSDLGSYRIPKELKDEDKWFKFFTKKQLLIVGSGLALSIVIVGFFYGMHLLPVGVMMAEVVMLLSAGIAFVKIPTDKYLIGGGYPVSQILIRLVLKRLPGHRVLYVKNYEEDAL